MLVLIMLTVPLLQLMPWCEASTHTAERAYTITSMGVQKQVNLQWHPAVYKGLIIGRSTHWDMLRIFGEPKWSEEFDDGTGPPEKWAHYDGGGEFPGELVFNVDRQTGVILRLILHPTKLSKEEAIKHFGTNYKTTRYEFCKGFEDQDSAPIYETSSGQFLRVEYRAKGIALAIGGKDEVKYISYVSEPLGSNCNK
jgi:hypothetical protein